jgi:hypothetical protein
MRIVRCQAAVDAPLNGERRRQCALKEVLVLLSQCGQAGPANENVDVLPFMEWFVALRGISLRRGVMEDPHEFLMALFEKISMAGV